MHWDLKKSLFEEPLGKRKVFVVADGAEKNPRRISVEELKEAFAQNKYIGQALFNSGDTSLN